MSNLPSHLLGFNSQPIKVLDHGSVQLIDVMGSDQSVVNAARVSYREARRLSEDKQLLRYLLRHRHTSPFEMCEIVLRVECPFVIWKQWLRHRTASVNEISGRYSEMSNDYYATEHDAWRLQATDNKQGSDGLLTAWPEGFVRVEPAEDVPLNAFSPNGGWVEGKDAYQGSVDGYYGCPGSYLSGREQDLLDHAREVYEERLAFGVAKEQARKDLPLSQYMVAYWKLDLWNLLHFLHLRLDGHAQLEFRLYAEAIATIVKEWVPWSWAAFEDYIRYAMTFSRKEVQGLWGLMQWLLHQCPDHLKGEAIPIAVLGSTLPESEKNRETNEFREKLRVLLEPDRLEAALGLKDNK